MNPAQTIYYQKGLMDLIYSFDPTYKNKFTDIIKNEFNDPRVNYNRELQLRAFEKYKYKHCVGLLDKNIKYKPGTIFKTRNDRFESGNRYVITKVGRKYYHATVFSAYTTNESDRFIFTTNIEFSRHDEKYDKEGTFVKF